MLPSRSRLQGWNPDSLSPAGKAVDAAGQSMYGAVRSLEDGIDRLPDAGVWQGHAHEAATGMFRRATNQTSDFAAGAGAVGTALSKGDSTIGAARYWLLRAADDIDEGELRITDQWVVLIKPARMSAQHAAELQHQAEHDQAEINQLLLALGDADDGTAANVQAAAQKLGFTLPGPSDMASLFPQAPSRPADEVPNPRTMQGLVQQGAIRGEDMGTSVREVNETKDKDGNCIKTLTMQDGGKQVITMYNQWPPGKNPMPKDFVQVEHFDKDGKFISQTQSHVSGDGTKTTNIIWTDGTQFIATEAPDGTRTAAFTLPDGRYGVLPPNNPFFTGTFPQVLGGGLTALDAQAGRGGKFPMLTPESVENVGKAARFAGPAMGIATTIYDVGAAETSQEACVAGISGAFGVVGDYVGGDIGASVGTLGGPAAPVTVPFAAVGGAFLGGKGLGWIGHQVGEAVCRP